MPHLHPGITRRGALAVGLTGAAALAAGEPARAPGNVPGKDDVTGGSTGRMPVVYLPHGGGPWPFVDLGMDSQERDNLGRYLGAVSALPTHPPRALLVVSAHWEEAVPTVMTSSKPPMLYDYYGFPPESYKLSWPAPGEPALAAQVCRLLERAGFATQQNAQRGFDHGTFIPLMLAFPRADIPTVQLSLKKGLDPKEHLAMGRALAPLRDEGVFILGSGMSFHNMRAFGSGRATAGAQQFDAWLQRTAALPMEQRDALLTQWETAPGAREAHPREEHLLPLMVAAGAAGADAGAVAFNHTVMHMPVSAIHFG